MLLERVEQMAASGVSVDCMTMVLRSEGALDTDIASCYDSLVQSGRYRVHVERSIPWLVPLAPVI